MICYILHGAIGRYDSLVNTVIQMQDVQPPNQVSSGSQDEKQLRKRASLCNLEGHNLNNKTTSACRDKDAILWSFLDPTLIKDLSTMAPF